MSFEGFEMAGDAESSNPDDRKGGSANLDKKSWLDLRQSVRDVRRRLSNLSTKLPMNFVFRTVQLPVGSKVRLYFLSAVANGRETTLIYADLPDTSTDSIPVVAWNPLLESTFQVLPTYGRVSKEEQLQWERKRLVTWGITSYEMHSSSGRCVFPVCSSLFSCTDGNKAWNTPYFPSELKTICSGARLNPQICPSDPELVAYICNNDIWVQHMSSGSEQRLTFAHQGCKSLSDDPLSAGIPSYVTQEEFNRYNGFWWQPECTSYGIFRILYEEVDESDVEILYFASPNSEDRGVEEYRFPRAGTPNSKSTLKMMEFELDENKQIVRMRHLQARESLQELFPWLEYIVRVGWTPDAKHVWVQLLNRRQQHLELVLIPLQSFVTFDQVFGLATNHIEPPSPVQVLISEDSDVWINVHDIIHFYPQVDDSSVTLIWASERTGFRHLYLVTCGLFVGSTNQITLDLTEGYLKPRTIQEIMLTNGEWEVVDKQIWVDEHRQLVYFMALMDSPLEKHLYVVSLTCPGVIRRLTEPGFSHMIAMNKECTMFVSVYSSVRTSPASQVFRLNFDSTSSVDAINVKCIGILLEHAVLDEKYQIPEIFNCQIQSGETLYGMVFRPPNMDNEIQYPTVLSIYGGPEVQLVTNTFKGMRQLRLHMLADQGYIVVVVDSRGSRHRGLKFEGHLKERMGTVEISDQVEVLEWLAQNCGNIDLSRVAVHGWSYGGYLSLMGLAQRPDIFKMAIAGAPVTSWLLYDTGYTERYMDTPSSNTQGYKSGSVLSYINLFPNEENRLLIIHGLIDENVHFFNTSQLVNALVRAGKPYQLQVYPNERHSLRHLDASEHYETTLLSFLQTWL